MSMTTRGLFLIVLGLCGAFFLYNRAKENREVANRAFKQAQVDAEALREMEEQRKLWEKSFGGDGDPNSPELQNGVPQLLAFDVKPATVVVRLVGLAFAPDGSELLVACDEGIPGTLRGSIHRLSLFGRDETRYDVAIKPSGMAFTPDGSSLVLAGESSRGGNGLHYLNPKTLAEHQRLELEQISPARLQVTRDGNFVFLHGRAFDLAGVYDVGKKETRLLATRLRGTFPDTYFDSDLLPDDKRIVALALKDPDTKGPALHIFDLAIGNMLKAVKLEAPAKDPHGDRISYSSVASGQSGSKVIVVRSDGGFGAWDIDAEKQFYFTPPPKSSHASETTLAVSADGALAATNGNAFALVRLYNTQDGQHVATLVAKGIDPVGAARILAFSPDGKRLAAVIGGTDKPVLVWDVSNLRERPHGVAAEATPLPAGPAVRDP
jgi:WD40 repeat protein